MAIFCPIHDKCPKPNKCDKGEACEPKRWSTTYPGLIVFPLADWEKKGSK